MRAPSRTRGSVATRFLNASASAAVPTFAAVILLLSACTIPTDGVVAAPDSQTTTAQPALGAVGDSRAGMLPGNAPMTPLIGKSVFLDPGHSGSGDAAMTAQVPTGRGGTKDCQTTGTATATGYAEHTFTWQIVALMRGELEALGARVQLSRDDDTSVGRCVDERATMANASGADAVVSIHADGAGTDQHGFHVSYSSPPLNAVQGRESITLATVVRDTLVEQGMSPSTYIGTNGIYPRSDIAGLNLSDRPSILIELGNMRNPDEARQMTDDAGRAGYARAAVAGIAAYLGQR